MGRKWSCWLILCDNQAGCMLAPPGSCLPGVCEQGRRTQGKGGSFEREGQHLKGFKKDKKHFFSAIETGRHMHEQASPNGQRTRNTHKDSSSLNTLL